MRTFAVLLAASLGVAGLALTSPASGSTKTDCSRSISTSANSDSVAITLHQTCGRAYRAIGFWGGGPVDGYHYGTYHTWPGGNAQFSVACGDSSCDVGNVQWGGYQRKEDGKIFCEVNCSAMRRLPAVQARPRAAAG